MMLVITKWVQSWWASSKESARKRTNRMWEEFYAHTSECSTCSVTNGSLCSIGVEVQNSYLNARDVYQSFVDEEKSK